MRRQALVALACALTGCIGDIGDTIGRSDVDDDTPTTGGHSSSGSDDAVGAGGHGASANAVSASSSGSAGGGNMADEPCPADMLLAGAVCIDRFEAPNVAGASPLAFRTAQEGQAWCEERTKRLCTDVEWMNACRGASGQLYPYGDTHEVSRCNDDKTWKTVSWSTLAAYPAQAAIDHAASLYQADPSGSRGACVSEDGAYDLTGNVAEWVVRTINNSNNYDHVMKGCYWAGCYGGSHPSCDFVNPAHPGGFRTYEAGFRCCTEPR